MTIDTYRKKPAEVRAMRYNMNDSAPAITFCGGFVDRAGRLVIKTLEGDMRANQGDWIIEGIAGEYYPCKPDIFDKTYDLVEPEMTESDDKFDHIAEEDLHQY